MTASLPSRAETVRTAADWLATQERKPTPIVPALRSRFGLSPLEAVVAIREAGRDGRD